MRLTRAISESLTAFCDHFRIPLFPHQREDFGAATARKARRFERPLAGISYPRGDGKTDGGADTGLWRLVAGPPPQDIISVALDTDGARVVLDHARTKVRSRPELARAIEIRANALLVPATGSRWTVESREHTATRGRHPTLVIYDECGWARDDELFASLLAGQASVADPLMLVVSTVGRRRSGPLWTIKTLAEGGDTSVFWRWSSENRSPLVTKEFLERQRRILLPGQFAREHQNQWIDAADSFVSAQQVDAAMGRDGWTEQFEATPNCRHVMFVDIGLVSDPTVIGGGHRKGDMTFVDWLVTFQGSKEQPVQLAAVEKTIVERATRCKASKIRIESWQGFSAVQSLQRLNLPVEIFTPTAKTNAEEWPLLAQKLTAGTLTLFPHARLREELLNLVYEVGPSGVKVIDRGKVHQDHAVVVRGIVAMLTSAGYALSPESMNSALASACVGRGPSKWGPLLNQDPFVELARPTADYVPVRSHNYEDERDADGPIKTDKVY